MRNGVGLIMDLILFGIYLYAGVLSNSFLKHHVLKMQTAYVLNMQNFLLGKIIWAALLGWITIPIAIVLKLAGVGKVDGE